MGGTGPGSSWPWPRRSRRSKLRKSCSTARPGPLQGRAAGLPWPAAEDGGAAACLFAFDLLRLDGEDLRPLPLEERRARLRKALRRAGKALRFSEHLEGDGEAIFRHACALGLEGIVSKRRDARLDQVAASRG